MPDNDLWGAELLPDVEKVRGTLEVENPPVIPVNPDITKILEPAVGYPHIRFKVPGTPAPQGNKRGFAIKKGGVLTGKVAMVESGKNIKSYRTAVSETAEAFMAGNPPLTGPVRLSCLIQIPRPNSHYTSKRTLKKGAPLIPGHQMGDLDKLVRAVCDAMTGIVFVDDTFISTYMPPFGKRYGLDAATYIVVEPDPLDY